MYITTPYNSQTISLIIRNNLQDTENRQICVFDMMAGVGGDTIEFGKTFGSVISCEKDGARFNMLRNNIGVYSLSNVELHNECCLTLLPKVLPTVDVLYMDPPWGGKAYKDSNMLTLSIDNRPIEDVIRGILVKTTNTATVNRLKLIVLKLPKNYDLQHLYNKTKSPDNTILMYELPKMLIIVYKLRL